MSDKKAVELVEKAGELVETQREITERDIAHIEAQVELRSRMMKAVLKAVKSSDYVDFHGKPYLQGEGSERIAAVVGVSFGKPEIHRERKENGHLYVEAWVEVSKNGRSVIEIGDCASDDSFFWRGKPSAPQAPQDVNSADVVKKAIQNAKSRGVGALLGIKGLTWEELGEYGIYASDAAANVKFKNGSKGGKAKAKARPKTSDAKGGDKQTMEDLVKMISDLENMIADVMDLGGAEAEFLDKITEYNGSSYSDFEDIRTFVWDCFKKWGNCKPLPIWLKKGKECLAEMGGAK